MEEIESLRVRLSSLSYRELQKEAKENSISARKKKLDIIEALIRKHTRKSNSTQNDHNSDNLAIAGENVERTEAQTDNKENSLSAGDITIDMANSIGDAIFYEGGNSANVTFGSTEKRGTVNTENVSVAFTNPKSRMINFAAETTLEEGNSENVVANVVSIEEREETKTKDIANEIKPNRKEWEKFDSVATDFVEATFYGDDTANLANFAVGSGSRVLDFVDATFDGGLSEDAVAKLIMSENRENIRIDFDNVRTKSIGTPFKVKPKLSYTPYRGSFKYVDTTKMSNREFAIYQQKKEEEKKQVLNEQRERSEDIPRNDGWLQQMDFCGALTQSVLLNYVIHPSALIWAPIHSLIMGGRGAYQWPSFNLNSENNKGFPFLVESIRSFVSIHFWQMRGTLCHSPSLPRSGGIVARLLLGGLIIDHLLFQLILTTSIDAHPPFDSDFERDLLHRLLMIDRNAGGRPLFGAYVRNQPKENPNWGQPPLLAPFTSLAAEENGKPWQTEAEKNEEISDTMPKRNIATGRGDGFRPG
ncbi:hypothetical protein niasHS_010164 [Heterodera schachtii]|uniref:Uncharacterized protein n=1 Tax=Heterodera schachtii TaxID=97005 RepID=A0ABD2J4W7_HETSC